MLRIHARVVLFAHTMQQVVERGDGHDRVLVEHHHRVHDDKAADGLRGAKPDAGGARSVDGIGPALGGGQLDGLADPDGQIIERLLPAMLQGQPGALFILGAESLQQASINRVEETPNPQGGIHHHRVRGRYPHRSGSVLFPHVMHQAQADRLTLAGRQDDPGLSIQVLKVEERPRVAVRRANLFQTRGLVDGTEFLQVPEQLAKLTDLGVFRYGCHVISGSCSLASRISPGGGEGSSEPEHMITQ